MIHTNRSMEEVALCSTNAKSLFWKRSVLPIIRRSIWLIPSPAPVHFFNVGDTFLLKRTPQQDDF